MNIKYLIFIAFFPFLVGCAPLNRLSDAASNGVVDVLIASGSGARQGMETALTAIQGKFAPRNEYLVTKVKDDMVVVYGRSKPKFNSTEIIKKARLRAAILGKQLGYEAFQIVYEGSNEVSPSFQDTTLQADRGWLSYRLDGWAEDTPVLEHFNHRLIVRLIKYDTFRMAHNSFNISVFLSQP